MTVLSVAMAEARPVGLVINAGSSSLKTQLRDGDDRLLWKGQTPWQPNTLASPGPNAVAMDILQAWLLPALTPWQERLGLVGHRVVHGGTLFTAPTPITAAVRHQLAALMPLAPLHNGPALALMEAIHHWRPTLPQWACFDTAFHHTLPPEAFTYAIPSAWRQEGLRRFGFHGLSHQHVSDVVTRQWRDRHLKGNGEAPLRLISCHLGAGCSLCAIREGRSIATTMGFTPMDGLVMATRSGALDPGLLLHQLRQGLAPDQLDQDLNQRSGLYGLSDGLSSSMKDLRAAAARGHGAATLAIGVFRHGLLQGIGAMAASLGGVDVIALTGGIGEHDAALREELTEALGWLGPFAMEVVPADEEGLISRQCRLAAGLA
jgi:acetate kinase